MIDFKMYHSENPHIWEAFKKYSIKAMNKGFDHYSANGIFEQIRWHSKESGNDGYKINNIYRPDYARKMMAEFPHFKNFFRIRETKAIRS